MMEIFLDNHLLDIQEDTSIGLTLGISDIEDPTSSKSSFTKTIDVPMTARNRAIFGHTEEILSPRKFNNEEHTASIFVDGIHLIEGKAYLDSIHTGYYSLQIVGSEFDWVRRIKDKALNEIDDDKVSVLTKYELLDDVQRDKIFFALIEHGAWHQEVGDNVVPRLWATYADLVPFISFEAILKSIFKGYIVAGFLSSSGLITAKNIYVTGKFKEIEGIEAIREDNEFEVSCSVLNVRDVPVNGVTYPVVGVALDNTAVGDEARYIDAFDTVDEDTNSRIFVEEVKKTNSDGATITHRYLYFEPTQEIITAFDLHLKYASQFSVKNNQLVFADTVHFNGLPVATISPQDCADVVNIGNGEPLNAGAFNKCSYPASVVATIEDTDSGGKSITIPQESMTYFYLELNRPEMYDAVVQISWYETPKDVTNGYYVVNQTQILSTNIEKQMIIQGACCFEMTVPFNAPGTTNARIGLRTIDGDVVVLGKFGEACYRLEFISYNPNLFEGYKLDITYRRCDNFERYKDTIAKLYKFTESDMLTLDLRLQTSGYRLLPDIEPLPLVVGFTSSNGTLLDDGEQLLVTVSEGSTISPRFNSVRPYGYRVSLNDVGGDVKAIDVLKSIMSMFNLRLLTNAERKEVLYLPLSAFNTPEIVDWSDRLDLDEEVSITAIVDGIGREFVLSYKGDSAPVEYYNRRHRDSYLSWRTSLDTLANEDTYELQAAFNPPMFKSVSEVFGRSADGEMLDVADRGVDNTLEDFNANDIPTTIVLIPTPDKIAPECVILPTTGVLGEYVQPRMSVSRGIYGSLDFNELSKGYQGLLDTWNHGKRIVCYCRILPQEIDSLRNPGTSDVSFRSLFKLRINDEDILCRLESIDNYEPLNASHKCTFIY